MITYRNLLFIFVVWVIVFSHALAAPSETKRFFYSGDGHIRLINEKNGKRFNGRYRNVNGVYDNTAYRIISDVFNAPYSSEHRILSLRLVEFLDFLQDRLSPQALFIITSGYRPPQYNTRLRKKGALAAKASLHQYGMAADFIMQGVPSKRVWDYVRLLGFGGTGYYHGKTVHVDVGPARFWDEKSSGVGKGLANENKLIGIITDFDVYRPGDLVNLTFIRMTAFPIHLYPHFTLISKNTTEQISFRPATRSELNDGCVMFSNIRQMASLGWHLPSNIMPGRYIIQGRFCRKKWATMPETVTTPEIEILRQPQ